MIVPVSRAVWVRDIPAKRVIIWSGVAVIVGLITAVGDEVSGKFISAVGVEVACDWERLEFIRAEMVIKIIANRLVWKYLCISPTLCK